MTARPFALTLACALAIALALTITACSGSGDTSTAKEATPTGPAEAVPPPAVAQPVVPQAEPAQSPAATRTPTPGSAPAPRAAAPQPTAEVAVTPEPRTRTESESPARRRTPPAEPELNDAEDLSLTRLTVATEIRDREPVGASSRFSSADERIYAYLQVRNDAETERELVVTFEGPGGRVTGNATLTVPGGQPRWRTWASSRNVRAAGRWEAIVKTADGEVLGRVPFDVAARSGTGA